MRQKSAWTEDGPAHGEEYMEVHQRVDAFELRVLARPAPPMDVLTLQAALESLLVDLDTILEARVPESKAPSTEQPRILFLAALFSTAAVPPPPPCQKA